MDVVMFYGFVSVFSLTLMWICIYCCCVQGQKSREAQQRPRMYVNSGINRTSLTAQAPSIYITPANMPPPKYEAMAPPSYEEVVGIHYPPYASTAAQPAPAQTQYASTAAQPAPAQTAAQPPPGYETASTASAAPVAIRTVPAETTISLSS